MSERLCSVNNLGQITYFVEGIIPEFVPKVKHPPRELHPDYANFLKQYIAEKVKLKRQLDEQKKINDRKLLEIERQRLMVCKRHIMNWFN